ncbi:MAG: dTDP-4-dehydrorhamnose 3,5-epimerase [Rhodospirillales bacterium]|nr:dTDP-4-dehydrorhamnose 3,5-epimerase [Rhodospirillales bacterium]
MRFTPTKIPEVILVEPDVFGDARGFLMETYHADKFTEGGIAESFVQDNHSRSVKRTLRGLHYQLAPFAQGKLVRVLSGVILDVAVDVRPQSPTFKKWVSAELSDDNKHQLWVPAGFAHGFLVLSETADVAYKCTAVYAPEHERAIIWNDPDIGIDWPTTDPVLSDKDAIAPRLADQPDLPG